MFRVSRRIIFKARASLFWGALVMVVYLCKDYFVHTIIVQEDVENNGSKIMAPLKNGSYEYSQPRCQKNVSADNIEGFQYLSNMVQDFLYYRHCRHFPMLLDIPDKCRKGGEYEDIFLLLVIKTHPANYQEREVLRKTWAKERVHNGVWIRRIFISGTTHAGWEKERLNKLLQLEQREHNDILQWDFNESLFNLTLKQILFLQWMEKNCLNARFLLNGDDDVFANTDNMVEYLQGLKDNNGSKHLFSGHLIRNAGVIRNVFSKYFIPLQVYKLDSYPPYCGGGGFLMSVYTALVIHEMSKSMTIHPIDDVFMGMCLVNAKLNPVSHMAVRTLGWYIPSNRLDKYDPCYFKEHLLVHRLLPTEMFIMWHRVNDPDLKCGTSKKFLEGNQPRLYRW